MNSTEDWDRRAAEAATSWEAAMWSEQGQTRRMERVVERLQLRPDDHVLDWGCGTGRFCEFLPPNVFYTGVDTSPGMRVRAGVTYPQQVFMQPLDALRDYTLYTHIVAIGPWNLKDGWSKAQTRFELGVLWNREPKPQMLVASLYAGEDDRCIRYEGAEIASWGGQLASYWQVSHHLRNDSILMLIR